MQPRSRMTVFFWGFALAMALGSAAAVGLRVSGPRSEAETVLVVVVGDSARLAQLRAAVPQGRLIVDAPDGFAVRGGRIIAASADAAGPILTQAGWGDAQLDIFMSGQMPRRYDSPPAEVPESARIRELFNKPELSLLESRELLRWMESAP